MTNPDHQQQEKSTAEREPSSSSQVHQAGGGGVSDFFFGKIAGLFDDESIAFSLQTPVGNPLAMPSTEKPKHKSNVSWGVLPNHVPPSPPTTTINVHRQQDDGSTAIPSVIAIDPTKTPEEPQTPLPPIPPKPSLKQSTTSSRSHKRTMTSAQIPSSAFLGGHNNILHPSKANSKPAHKRTMTLAQAPASTTRGLFTSDRHISLKGHHMAKEQEFDVSSLPPPNNDLPGPKVNKNSKHLHIDLMKEIIGAAPYELEAETYILQALEVQVEEQRPRLEKEQSPILPFLSDEALQNMSVVDHENEEEEEKEEGIECIETQSTNTKQTVRTRQTAKQETRSLLGNDKKHSKHRHTQSVEQKLFGLTAALSAMEGSGKDDGREEH